jgi:predicted phosphodiesterase
MSREQVDFIIQLGDFCVPKKENLDFLQIWNQSQKPSYHVLGNHDTDGGYTRQQTVDYWGMDSRFYSFDQGGIHFVVLDGNDTPTHHQSGYPRYIAGNQIEWLRNDLAQTGAPTIVFAHQSIEFEEDDGIENGAEIRNLLEETNRQAGFQQVMACFSGHHHRDYARWINDILYPQINSASYYWVGGDYLEVRYNQEIDDQYPWIKYTVPYQNPIYGIVTVDLQERTMGLNGRISQFVGSAPWELGKTREYWNDQTLTASVSNWKVLL